MSAEESRNRRKQPAFPEGQDIEEDERWRVGAVHPLGEESRVHHHKDTGTRGTEYPLPEAEVAETEAAGRDLSGWYVVYVTVSAHVFELTCNSKEEAIGLRAEIRSGALNPSLGLTPE